MRTRRTVAAMLMLLSGVYVVVYQMRGAAWATEHYSMLPVSLYTYVFLPLFVASLSYLMGTLVRVRVEDARQRRWIVRASVALALLYSAAVGFLFAATRFASVSLYEVLIPLWLGVYNALGFLIPWAHGLVGCLLGVTAPRPERLGPADAAE